MEGERAHGFPEGDALEEELPPALLGVMAHRRQKLEPLVLGPHERVHHVRPLAAVQVEPPLLAGGVLGLSSQPSLGLGFALEEHPLALAVDLSIDEPNRLAPLFDLLNLHCS